MNKKFTLAIALLLMAAIGSLQSQTVFFEEQFDGGLNGWTTVTAMPYDTALWVWEPLGSVGSGALAPANLAIMSATASNGAAVFNGDFEISGGVQANIPPAPYPRFSAQLISPTIDLSSTNAPVSLKFTQLTRQLNLTTGQAGKTIVEASTDNGVTWGTPIVINPGLAVNAQPRNTTEIVPVPGIQGSSQVRLRFTYNMDFYYWAIDDISIEGRVPHDMALTDQWFAIPPSFQTPKSQVEAFGFMADVANKGGTDQTNVTLTAEISTGGSSVYTGSYDYGTIIPDSTAENIPFGDFTPAATVGMYTGTYTVSADSIDNLGNDNTLNFAFEVTDSIYSKESGATRNIYPATANWTTGEARKWAYGNHYYITNGTGYQCATATFAFVGTAANKDENLNIVLYSWDDVNGDGNCDPDERTIEGISQYVIQGNEAIANPRTVPINSLITDNAPQLKDNTDYVLMVEYDAPAEIEVRFAASDLRNYGAMVFNSQEISRPRYSCMLGISGDLGTEAYSSVGFGRNLAPVVRMNVSEFVSNTNDNQLADGTVSVMPNPATDNLNVRFDLPSTAKQVFATVFNAQGTSVLRQNYQNITNETRQLDVSQLPAGAYFLMVQTDDSGFKTVRFVKQ